MSIIDLDEARRAGLREREPFRLKRGPECQHLTRELDETARTVVCGQCGSTLDPFGELLRLAQEWNTYWDLLQVLKAQVSASSGQLDYLKREVTNAKAQLKRAQNTK